jgi:hypothetical protein
MLTTENKVTYITETSKRKQKKEMMEESVIKSKYVLMCNTGICGVAYHGKVLACFFHMHGYNPFQR